MENLEQFRAETREWLEANCPEDMRQPMRSDEDQCWGGRNWVFKSEGQKLWLERMAAKGWTAPRWPTEYGGGGLSGPEAKVLGEEMARIGARRPLSSFGLDMLGPALLLYATEEQKQQYIPDIINGKIRWCQGYSEPNAGSDLASLRTKADDMGDHYLINGSKVWTSYADKADWIFCLVRTEPDAPKHLGISFLLFRMDTPGIEIRPLVDMTGDANFNEVFFTDVRVPKHQIVGQRGQGWQVANAILGHERGSLATPDAAMNRLNGVKRLMREESINGEPIMSNPVFRDRLMKLEGRVLAMQYNDMRLLSAKINKNQDVRLAGMIVKLIGTELRHEIECLGIDVMGEIGLSYGDNPHVRGHGSWQYQYMFYLGLIIGGGTSQIQKNIISERGLGMPKEPKIPSEKSAEKSVKEA